MKISFLKNEHTISRWPINFFSFVRRVNGWSIRLSVVLFPIYSNSQSEARIKSVWPIRRLCISHLFHICSLVAWEQNTRALIRVPVTLRELRQEGPLVTREDCHSQRQTPTTIKLLNESLKCVHLHKPNFSDTPDWDKTISIIFVSVILRNLCETFLENNVTTIIYMTNR